MFTDIITHQFFVLAKARTKIKKQIGCNHLEQVAHVGKGDFIVGVADKVGKVKRHISTSSITNAIRHAGCVLGLKAGITAGIIIQLFEGGIGVGNHPITQARKCPRQHQAG